MWLVEEWHDTFNEKNSLLLTFYWNVVLVSQIKFHIFYHPPCANRCTTYDEMDEVDVGVTVIVVIVAT